MLAKYEYYRNQQTLQGILNSKAVTQHCSSPHYPALRESFGPWSQSSFSHSTPFFHFVLKQAKVKLNALQAEMKLVILWCPVLRGHLLSEIKVRSWGLICSRFIFLEVGIGPTELTSCKGLWEKSSSMFQAISSVQLAVDPSLYHTKERSWCTVSEAGWEYQVQWWQEQTRWAANK